MASTGASWRINADLLGGVLFPVSPTDERWVEMHQVRDVDDQGEDGGIGAVAGGYRNRHLLESCMLTGRIAG